jgi:hypothetical protein
MTSQCEVQKGLKTFAFPIDARSDVCNHEVIRESRLEKMFLSVKVVHLLGGRDTTITCFLWCSRDRQATKNVLKRREIVAALSGWSSNKVDLTLRSPVTKSLGGNVEEVSGFFSRNKFIHTCLKRKRENKKGFNFLSCR